MVVTRNIQFSWGFLFPCSALLALIGLVWAFPACVGIWTQIRKSLPSFARAPKTILAASFYECHRMIYSAVIVVLLLAVDAWPRWYGTVFSWPTIGFKSLAPFLVLGMGAAGWMGPVRSDYTRQLVRSRRHAVRIFLMYAVAFPAITVFAVVALIVTIKAGY